MSGAKWKELSLRKRANSLLIRCYFLPIRISPLSMKVSLRGKKIAVIFAVIFADTCLNSVSTAISEDIVNANQSQPRASKFRVQVPCGLREESLRGSC